MGSRMGAGRQKDHAVVSSLGSSALQPGRPLGRREDGRPRGCSVMLAVEIRGGGGSEGFREGGHVRTLGGAQPHLDRSSFFIKERGPGTWERPCVL